MIPFIAKIVIVLISFWSSLAANASVTYVSDCGLGAEPVCVAGSNDNVGDDPMKPRRNLVGFSIKNLPDGEHVVAFARGSAVPHSGLYYPGNAKKATQRLVFTDYKPAWGGTALPIWRFSLAPGSTSGAGVTLISGGSGYVFRNLELIGPGAPAWAGTGFFLFRNVSDVLIDNVTIREFGIGVNSANSEPKARVENVTLRNSRIIGNHTQGWLGGGYKTVIENNIFDNNGFKGGIRYHNIYLSTVGENMVIRNNRLSNSAVVNGRCTGVSLVGHGTLIKTLIEGNTITESNVHWGCYGIQINGYQHKNNVYMGFDGTIIRGNTVVLAGETGAVGIGVNACPDCVIENNTIVGKTTATFLGIVVPDGSFTSAGSKDNAITVRNNSIYIDSPAAHSVGISANAPDSLNDVVVSNMIYFGPRAHAGATCFKTKDRVRSSYAAFGHNLCFREGGAVRWSDQHGTLAAAQASGWSDASMSIDPLLAATPSAANHWSMAVRPGSPAIDRGNPSLSAVEDLLKKQRLSSPDVGAFEFGNKSATVPGSPTGLIAQ